LIQASFTEAARFGKAFPTSTKVIVATLDQGLLVDYCRKVGASVLIKGVRNNADLEYELPMARVNRDLAAVETIFMPADPGQGFVSSSLVKQVAELGGSVDNYVPAAVVKALKASIQQAKG
jgi:pantetheine-phosphate adenylyltransferase